MALGNYYKYLSEITCDVQIINRVKQYFYILARLIFYPKHFPHQLLLTINYDNDNDNSKSLDIYI
jgi:hypothetical protein